MPFSNGDFDIVSQVETTALDVLTDIILKQLEKDNKTKFSHQIGGGSSVFSIDVELTDISIPTIRTINMNERFKSGNTLTSFEVEAELKFSLFGASLNDTLAVRLKDLQIGIFTTPGGLPLGVSLGFQKIDLDVSGLGFMNGFLNTLVDFVALGIRVALSPLGMVPIPILQFADAFTTLGLSFDRRTATSTADGSPFIGISQSQTGLFLAADFQAANNPPADITAVNDLLSSTMNSGVQVHQRLMNQMLTTALIADKFGLVRSISSGGVTFAVNSINVRFEQPGRRAARIGVDVAASARVKAKKGGFLGKLFGKKKKITIRAYATLDLDTGVEKDPQTQLSVVAFDFDVTVRGQVTVNGIFAAVLTVVFGPFLLVFLTILSQLLNFAFSVFLPEKFKFDVSGSNMVIRIDKITTQLGVGATLGIGNVSSATLTAEINGRGGGHFELEHFTIHKFASSGVPLAVDYFADSLETRPNELFLGTNLRSI